MVEEGEDVSAFESFTLDDAGGEKAPPKEKPKEEAAESTEEPDSGSGTAPPSPEGKEGKESAPAPQESDSTAGTRLETSLDRYRAAPKADAAKAPSPAAAAASAAAGVATYEDIPASSMRKTIAQRLKESMNQNPHYFVSTTLSVTKLLKLRESLNASSDGKYKLSLNDFLIKACAVACLKVPTVKL